jgi:hypothetical protein
MGDRDAPFALTFPSQHSAEGAMTPRLWRSGLPPSVYFEDDSGGLATAKLLTRDEARRIAANVAKLPEPLRTDHRIATKKKAA